jgi:hypothetical protein
VKLRVIHKMRKVESLTALCCLEEGVVSCGFSNGREAASDSRESRVPGEWLTFLIPLGHKSQVRSWCFLIAQTFPIQKYFFPLKTTSNPSYVGGRDWEDQFSASPGKKIVSSHLNK